MLLDILTWISMFIEKKFMLVMYVLYAGKWFCKYVDFKLNTFMMLYVN